MYIIKQIPEDFIVEEVPDKEFDSEKKESSKYSVYILKKTNYNTEDAVQEICRHLNIQRKNIGYAGAKDRSAITSQYISIFRKSNELKLKDLELKHTGFSDSPISLGSLKGNKFKITIRNLDEQDVEKLKANSKMNSFINYFDSQRFSRNNAEIGKLIITKKYKEACELIMSENSKNSEDLRKSLDERKNAYLNAIKLVPRKTLMIYLHAYQSLLWNMAVEKLISEKKETENVPLLGFGTELEEDIKNIYEKILLDENISLRDFILRDFPEISLEGDYRRVKVNIEQFKMQDSAEDELNERKKKIIVEFFLEKGAYATMAVKNLVGTE